MKTYIGVDVSKPQLDVDWQGEALQIKNNTLGINDLVRKLKVLHQDKELNCVVLEASGGYEKSLVNKCRENNIPVHVAHANKVRSFAKSKEILAKTDKLDAAILSEYGLLPAKSISSLKTQAVYYRCLFIIGGGGNVLVSSLNNDEFSNIIDRMPDRGTAADLRCFALIDLSVKDYMPQQIKISHSSQAREAYALTAHVDPAANFETNCQRHLAGKKGLLFLHMYLDLSTYRQLASNMLSFNR